MVPKMKLVRAATPPVRRAAHVAAVAALCGSAVVFAGPVATASASPVFTAGSLLVSTSIYDDLPNITAGTTVLPINSTQFNVSNVTSSGTAPSITATITTSAKNSYVVGQTVVIAGVGGATGVNGTWTITSIPSSPADSFTISTGSTAVGTYTSGGTTTGDIAIAGAQYPYVFNNDAVDANFGITEPIYLDQILATTSLVTTPISQTEVPNSDTTTGDQLVTSYSSKSELAIDQSTDGQYVSFVGYDAPTAAIDVSNANTPNEVDPTNTDTTPGTSGTGYYRDAAVMSASGTFQFTETGAYGGNNGRAAILDPANSTLFLAGNAGNGSTPSYQGVVIGSGSQITTEASTSEASQDAGAGPGAPTPYGNFNITQVGDTADKSTKDDNFRGLTQYNGVVYMSKGSGSNGINTVYFVDTTGTACQSSSGQGVPQSGASLPSASSWPASSLYPTYNTSNTSLGLSTSNPGLSPTNMCILKGFPTVTAKSATKTNNNGVTYPFGLWFANPTTLYVADEGSGNGNSADTTGGLQKWTFNGTEWVLQYTLQSGLNLLTAYTSINPSPAGVNGGAAGQTYPTGTNSTQGGQGGNWTPETDGLRNIVGQVNGNGTVTIWAITSTVSGGGDQGADPNEVVAITDNLSATGPTAPSGESFSEVMAPTDGVVYRGVSFTPTTAVPYVLPEVPWVPLLPVLAALAGGGYFWLRSRRRSALAL